MASLTRSNDLAILSNLSRYKESVWGPNKVDAPSYLWTCNEKINLPLAGIEQATETVLSESQECEVRKLLLRLRTFAPATEKLQVKAIGMTQNKRNRKIPGILRKLQCNRCTYCSALLWRHDYLRPWPCWWRHGLFCLTWSWIHQERRLKQHFRWTQVELTQHWAANRMGSSSAMEAWDRNEAVFQRVNLSSLKSNLIKSFYCNLLVRWVKE